MQHRSVINELRVHLNKRTDRSDTETRRATRGKDSHSGSFDNIRLLSLSDRFCCKTQEGEALAWSGQAHEALSMFLHREMCTNDSYLNKDVK